MSPNETCRLAFTPTIKFFELLLDSSIMFTLLSLAANSCSHFATVSATDSVQFHVCMITPHLGSASYATRKLEAFQGLRISLIVWILLAIDQPPQSGKEESPFPTLAPSICAMKVPSSGSVRHSYHLVWYVIFALIRTSL